MKENTKKELLEILDNLSYNSQWLWCWLEDCNITDRYEAMEYWWDKAIEGIMEYID